MLLKNQLLQNAELWGMVQIEGVRQVQKWGVQERTPFEWMTYVTEEVGETAKAISEHEYRGGMQSTVVKEAIQAATLLLKIAEMYILPIPYNKKR